MVVFLLISLVVFAFWFHAYLVHEHWKKKNVPYVPGFPFIGAKKLVLMQESIGTYLHGLYTKTKENILGFYILGKPALLVKDVDVIRQILIKDFQYFHDRTMGHNKTHDPIGAYILFILPNPDWKQVRKNTSPAFSSGKMKSMAPLICKAGEGMLEFVNRQNHRLLDPKELCAKYSTDVITSCAFGVEGNCFTDENSPFWKVSRKVFEFSWIRGISFACHFLAPSFLKLFQLKFLDPFAATFLRKVMWDCVEFRIATKTTRNDFVDSIIDINNTVQDTKFYIGSDIVVAQAAQFFLAGFETVSTTMTMALYELSKNQVIQKNLYQNIRAMIAKHGKITYEAISEMEYLDMVLHETLRKYPVLPFLDRKAAVDYTLPGTDTIIDKGTLVYISTLGLHLDPQYYPEPEKFDPSRFSAENKQSRPAFTYLPFGEGQRNCIGARFGILSAKIGLVHLLSNFSVLPTKDTPKEIKFDPKGFLLSSTETVFLEFRKIDAT